MRTPFIVIFACLSSLSASALAAPTVAIGEVTGPTGAQVGYAVEQALADKVQVVPNRVWEQTASRLSIPPDAQDSLPAVARELGAQAVIVGDVSRVGREWQGKLRVYEVATGQFTKEWTFDTSSLRNLSKIARRQVYQQLGAALRASEEATPAAPPPAVAAPPTPAASDVHRVVILPFVGGSRADGVRKVVVQQVEVAPGIERIDEGEAIAKAREIGILLKDPVGRVAVGELMNVNAYVFGEVFYRGGWYYAVIEVDQGLDGAQVDLIKLKRRGLVSLGNAVAERLIPAVRAAKSPLVPEPPPPAPPPSLVLEDDDEPAEDAAAQAEAKAPRERGPRGPRSRSPLEVSLGFTSFFRTFDFNQPLTPQRPYEASFLPAIALTARWYPIAHFSDHWSRNIGLDVAADYAVGLSSTDRVTDDEFPTNSFTFLGGLRGRLPIGPSELGAVVSFGTDRFALDPTEQGVPAETPSVEYVFARFGADGRIRVIPQLDFGFGGGFRLVTDAGQILSDDWFPNADVGAFDATVKLGTPILDPVHFEAGVNYIHYYFSFNVTPEDAAAGRPLAGGALDQYTEIFLRAVFVL